MSNLPGMILTVSILASVFLAIHIALRRLRHRRLIRRIELSDRMERMLE